MKITFIFNRILEYRQWQEWFEKMKMGVALQQSIAGTTPMVRVNILTAKFFIYLRVPSS